MSQEEACMRLILSAILGGVIGYERQYKHKTAGLRTNILVCVGSCLIMLLSQLLYNSVEGKTNADPARLAAQVVSGIGFLGAGAIIKERVNIIGLTTAACVWVVAGVGLAVGAGYYWGAVVTAAIVVTVLVLLSRMDNWMNYRALTVIILTEDVAGQIMKICRLIQADGIEIRNMQIKRLPNGIICLEFNIFREKAIVQDDINMKLSQLENIINVEVI